MRKKELSLWLLAGIFLEIILLINLPVANSYNIGQSNKLIENANTEINDKRNSGFNVLNYGLDLLIGFLSIKQIGVVSAQSDSENVGEELPTWNCCPLTSNGAICQDQSSDISQDECAVSALPTSCDEVSSCQLGCCVDPVEGTYSTNAPRQACEVSGGQWFNNPECLIPEAQKGCCVLGSDVEFVTETRCSYLSLLNGFSESYFEDVQTELQCLALKETQKVGACVLNQGRCSFITELSCAESGGVFHENQFCSVVEENCERQSYIGCVEGKDEIYWFDSCGNQENIYSSDRQASYNNGMFLSKNDSCNPLSGNANSETCGNCNYFLGSTCSETLGAERHVPDGNFICEDLSCDSSELTSNKDRKNGESWCLYDSSIGEVDENGKQFASDAVGSRHWKASCIDGEVKVEGCADFRGEICVQGKLEDSSVSFSSASCIKNEASICVLDKNAQENAEDIEDACLENEQCMLKNIDVDEGFEFDFCVGKYPRGFDLSEDNQAEKNTLLCSQANQKCTVVYEKKITGKWECIFNCNCESDDFAEQMNDLCISLGDCGSYVNIAGQGTDNIKSDEGSVSWQDYKGYENPIPGKIAEPGDISDILPRVFNIETGEEQDLDLSALAAYGTVAGALGGIFAGAVVRGAIRSTLGGGYGLLQGGQIGLTSTIPAGDSVIFSQSAGAVVGWSIAGAAIGAVIGTAVGIGISKMLGISGDGATIIAVAGSLAGAVIGAQATLHILAGQGLVGCLDPATCVAAIIILAIIIIVVAILGIGDTKEVEVEFTCLPWSPPTASNNCELCGNDPDRPWAKCTEYRCKSLGQNCQLENPNDENPICVSTGNDDSTPPRISAGEILTNGYRFENEIQNEKVEIRTSNSGCIQEFTPVRFSLQTDEYSQCKFDLIHKESYEEMSEFFLEQTAYKINHTNLFMMPSISALEAEYGNEVIGNIRESFADLDMFVRCKDSQGNFNNNEYIVNFCVQSGPDVTAPEIKNTNPRNGATIGFGVEETTATFYLNEPAECKFDIVDLSYEEMTNTMICRTGLQSFTQEGWPCTAALTDLQDENTFYIRCQDQPWLVSEQDQGKRNENQESYVYELNRAESELRIDSISPQGTITECFQPVVVELEVETSGGVNNGEAECRYSFTGYGQGMTTFKNTLSSSHSQRFDQMTRGAYNIYIKCEDVTGSVSYGNATFTLDLDVQAPIPTRVFNVGNQLKIITNEQAECVYDTSQCSFNFENATSMTTAFSTEHFADWNQETTYHVKCRDICGNTNVGCGIVVQPSADF